MNNRISLYALGNTASLFIVIIYTLCFLFDLVFPQYAMYSVWQVLFPGFNGLSWVSFFIGLVEAYAYGWFFAVIWAPLYNYFLARHELT